MPLICHRVLQLPAAAQGLHCLITNCLAPMEMSNIQLMASYCLIPVCLYVAAAVK